jgi:hypothetical protein
MSRLMLSTNAIHQSADVGLPNTELLGQLSLKHATLFPKAADLGNLFISKLYRVMGFSSAPALRHGFRSMSLASRGSLSSFAHHVVDVVLGGAEEPTARVHAPRMITAMADQHPLRNGSDKVRVSPPRCHMGFPSDLETAVSVVAASTGPRPAHLWTTRSVNVFEIAPHGIPSRSSCPHGELGYTAISEYA